LRNKVDRCVDNGSIGEKIINKLRLLGIWMVERPKSPGTAELSFRANGFKGCNQTARKTFRDTALLDPAD